MRSPFIYIVHLFITYAFVLGTVSPVVAQPVHQINLSAGESHVFTTDFVIEQIAIGDPQICGGLKTGDRELLINAKKAGQSNILVWGGSEEKIEIQVFIQDSIVGNTAEELREITKDIEGVSIRLLGNRIFVEGQVFTNNAMNRIEKIIAGIPNVVNLVEYSPVMKKIVKEEIEKSLSGEGMKQVKVNIAKNTFMLTGTVNSESESTRAQRIAEAYSPGIVNAIAVRVPKPVKVTEQKAPPPKSVLIEMALNIMEVERGALRDFGVHWNPDGNLGGAGTLSRQTGQGSIFQGALAGTITDLMPKMRRINETGRGRSLMQQTLITQNGDEASFFAGSEIPVSIAQPGGTMSVEYKKVGVTLNFSPDIDYYQNIVSLIKVESSSITGSSGTGSPIISNTNMSTVVSVPSGSSIALGGLIGQKEMNATQSAPPGGGTSLIQANTGDRAETSAREVVIFVTPRVLTAASKETDAIKTKVEEGFKQQELENLRRQMKADGDTSN
jgi:pilus assembly protein CpaC